MNVTKGVFLSTFPYKIVGVFVCLEVENNLFNFVFICKVAPNLEFSVGHSLVQHLVLLILKY